MDEPYLAAAARYVELNPVRANLVADAADWAFSSAQAHLAARDDRLVEVAPLLAIIDDWRAFLDGAIGEDQLHQIRHHARTGRPLGEAPFVERLERLVGCVLRRQKPGRKPRFPK